jgi:outer membrane protein OmpU
MGESSVVPAQSVCVGGTKTTRDNHIMKKLLLATTALVATAGVAAAEVTITGFAELGVFDPGDDDSLQFHTDIDATFTMTAETDSGLTFGADIDLDETDADETIPGAAINRGGDDVTGNVENIDTNGDGIISGGELNDFLDENQLSGGDVELGGSPAFDNASQGGESIFISGAFGTLTMGDTDGAFDWALQEAIIGSSLNDDHEHEGYNGNAGLDGTYDGQIARYEYAFGAFAGAVSAELDDDENEFGETDDPVIGIGVRYSTELAGYGVGLGLGYQRIDSISLDLGDDDEDEDEDDTDAAEIWGVSADVALTTGLRAIVNYSDADNLGDESYQHVGVALGYTVNELLTVAANYGRFDLDDDADTDEEGIDADREGYGVIANYDLGGGAEAQFGWSHNEVGEDDFNRYSAGIAISF